MSQHLIDLSYPLEAQTPVYPNYPSVKIYLLDSTARQEPDGPRHLNSSCLTIGLHCGTHLDAPFHFFGERNTVEQVPLERCIGPATLISLPHHGSGSEITVADLAPYQTALQETRKAILNTGWARHWGEAQFFTDHPVLTGEVAQWLVESGVHLVGVDFPSVDFPPHSAHLALLGNDVVIVENLTNLDAIQAETFDFIAFPLKIVGRDGSPVRAVGRF